MTLLYLLVIAGVFLLSRERPWRKRPDQAHCRALLERYRETERPLPPSDPTARYRLPVLFALDPKLEAPGESELAWLLRHAEASAARLLSLDVRFVRHRTVLTEDLFETRIFGRGVHDLSWCRASALSIDIERPDIEDHAYWAVRFSLEEHPRRRIAEYFGSQVDPEQVSTRMLEQLRRLHSMRDTNGSSLHDGRRKRHLQFSAWHSICAQEKRASVVITNSLIAGIEARMPIYTMARGGVSTGFVCRNDAAPHEGVVVLTLFPILSNNNVFVHLRGRVDRKRALEAASIVLLHELGHLLLHKTEDYRFPGSVHQAPRDLNYVGWAEKVLQSRSQHSHQIPAFRFIESHKDVSDSAEQRGRRPSSPESLRPTTTTRTQASRPPARQSLCAVSDQGNSPTRNQRW